MILITVVAYGVGVANKVEPVDGETFTEVGEASRRSTSVSMAV
jgi:hypothetical protein